MCVYFSVKLVIIKMWLLKNWWLELVLLIGYIVSTWTENFYYTVKLTYQFDSCEWRYEEFEDTKGVNRIHKSKKDRQPYGQKKKDRQPYGQKKKDRQPYGQKKKNKRTNNDLQNDIQWNLSNPTHQGTREMCQTVQDVGILKFYLC